VWIAGHLPDWVTGVGHIPVDQNGTKYANSTANLRAAAEHPDVSDEFTYFNDDFFVTKPVSAVPTAHRGPAKAVLDHYGRRYGQRRPYARGMAATLALLARLGTNDPVSYELHMPMTLGKVRLLEALGHGKDVEGLHKRTLYGNYWHVGGEDVPDVKLRSDIDPWPPGPFVSTRQRSWAGVAGGHIRAQFPSPCDYEVPRS
jgi:hypothetical protein